MATRARAYALQARADFDAYVASSLARVPALDENHLLHLMQMALEKFAKAILYHAEPDARYSHHVVGSAINRLRTHAMAEAAGIRAAVLWRQLDAAKPIFLQIEAASPSVGYDGRGLTREESECTANVEYPRQTGANDPMSWTAPASHIFSVVHDLRYDRRAVAAVRLLDRLITAADAVSA